jgi:hypothetical protein
MEKNRRRKARGTFQRVPGFLSAEVAPLSQMILDMVLFWIPTCQMAERTQLPAR